MEQISLFDNMKFCTVCHRALSLDYQDDFCPACRENALFNKVKEYIRSRDVTEYQVAEHFNIPHRQVKKWIVEGRIEYKEEEKRIENLHCSNCGEPITFGNLCQRCFRAKYQAKSGYAPLKASSEKDKMRFLEKDNIISKGKTEETN